MRNFTYRLLMRLADKLRPERETVEIKSVEHLDELLEHGFTINQLDIKINDCPIDANPLNITIKELAKQTIESNAVTLRGTITFKDQNEPEILYYIILTKDLVNKANTLLEKFEEENL